MLSGVNSKRDISLDILRILSMLMVVFFHYCVHGNGEQIFSALFSSQQAVSYLLGSWGLVGVTCFFMISSWFMLDRESLSVKKWVVLYVEVVAVHVLCLLITLMLGDAVTARQMLLAAVAPINGTYWYVTAYMLLLLLTPALNMLIKHCSDKNLIYLTCLSFFTTCILFPVLRFFGGSTGTSTLFLAITMYLLTACIKRRIVKLKFNGALMLTSFVLVASILFGMSFVATRTGISQIGKHIYDLVDIYSPIPVVLGVMMFVLFKDVVRISSTPKLIRGGVLPFVAKHTFAVYLLHENPHFRYLIWDKVFHIDVFYRRTVWQYLLHMVLVVLVLFALGVLLDVVVSKLGAKVSKMPVVKTICNRVDGYMNFRRDRMFKDYSFVFDIDGTLCPIKKKEEKYEDLVPYENMVQKLRYYKENGARIVLFTSRNMNSYGGNIGVINKHTAHILLDWLEKWDIPYDEILYGKPWPGHKGFYVDDRTVRPDEFLNYSVEELDQICKKSTEQSR